MARTSSPPYLYDAFPEQKAKLDALIDIGYRTAPDIESIANAKLDLILVNKSGKDADALYASLTEIAPTVVTQGTGLYWKQDSLLLSDALGKRQEAQS